MHTTDGTRRLRRGVHRVWRVRAMTLHCSDLSFRYGRGTVALDGLSASFECGVSGLLGPNGAGKSTLLSILATLRQPMSGTVTFDGVDLLDGDVQSVRRRIGYLPQSFDLMRYSTVERNVAYAAWCHGVDRATCYDRARDAIELVDLAKLRLRRVAHLSGGQRQRVGIACAIAHQPSLVLLDEPTAGLDPAQRTQMRSHIVAIAQTSVVVLSTHIVEDLAHMASSVVAIDQGRAVFTGAIEEIAALGEASPRTGLSVLESGYLGLLDRSIEPTTETPSRA